MKYSLMVSTIYYICGVFYIFFGLYAIASNVKSHINRLFLLVTSSMAIWALAYALSNSAPKAEWSAFWRSMSVYGWGIFHNLLLHFALILTNHKLRLNRRIVHAMLYLPALINIILFAPFGYLGARQYQMVPTDFGWRNVLPANTGQHWINFSYIMYTVITFILLIRWWKNLNLILP